MDSSGSGDDVDCVRGRRGGVLDGCGCGSSGSEIVFERFRLESAELVAGTDDVCAVVVRMEVKICEEGEHFGGMPTAAEDDKEMGWTAALAGGRTSWIGSGEDVEETELERYKIQESVSWFVS